MLLPYYIASMNIEHAYLERTNEYEPFEGICLVDTFDMRAQSLMFAEKNLKRIQRQVTAPIFVVIGNPPYNAWQVTENDNNKNRRYMKDGGVDSRVAEVYAKQSSATNKNALSDPYVKAFRWASDRIGKDGIVAFVTNSGFLDSLAADGMRKSLAAEFDEIYILDLGGNVRKNPKLSGTTHNVFGIQVGVSINILIRRDIDRVKRKPPIRYARVDELWRKEDKYAYLDDRAKVSAVKWQVLEPDLKGNWLNEGLAEDFGDFLPIQEIFKGHSRGIVTCRDAWAYNYNGESLKRNVTRSIDFYNGEVSRFLRADSAANLDAFVTYDDCQISWSRDLKQDLRRGRTAEFADSKIRDGLYRPFTKVFVFFDRVFNEEIYQQQTFFPIQNQEVQNPLIWAKTGSDWPFFALGTNRIPDVLPQGGSQCFPFYTYDEDGTNRRENITDWALAQFRNHYADKSISKWDIFHAIYAILHHPEYRSRYAANLKRELPRIPFVPEFHQYAKIGAALMKLHIEYEKQKEYPLQRTEKGALDWRVEKMRLSKDKTQLTYNDFLTLSGIPPEVHEYRLGNRSALEWVVDQYRVSSDKRSGIVNDPNRADDPEYIVRLIGQIITVSLETVKLVCELNELKLLPK